MKANKGFTLIEIMIVVTIIGILMAIAVPAYREHVRRSKVADVTASLSELRIRLEQRYQDNRTYVIATPALPTSEYFDFAYTILEKENYLITATGKKDMSGFAFTVNQANERTSKAWGVDGLSCWIMREGQTC